MQNETIITKMMKELQKAKEKVNDHSAMRQHVAHVQLLSELMLDEKTESTQSDEISSQEMKAMMGATANMKKNKNEEILKSLQNPSVEEGNGDSIFDF